MCKVFGVSRSGYYAWQSRSASNRQLENQRLTEQITQLFYQSNSSYGSPRITKALKEAGWSVSRPRVARLMRKAHLRSKVSRKYVVTTDSQHNYRISPNRLRRAFEPGKINRAWVSDITYIHTQQGWLYLTVVLDLGDRKVIGWSLSGSMKAVDTVIPALQMAMINRPPNHGTIFHSDRGVQYACEEFRKLLKQTAKLLQSMSRKGNCWDNAVAESFFKSLKSEWLNGTPFRNPKQAQLAVFQYIEIWYNRKRLHSALGYKTPQEYNLELNQTKRPA